MAASGGRRFVILASRIRTWMGETTGVKGQQRLGSSYPSTSSQIGSSAGSAAAFQSQERRNFATELKRVGGSSSGASAWRKLDPFPQSGASMVRNVSTIHPEAAAQGRLECFLTIEFLVVGNGGIEGGARQEGQEQPQKETTKDEANAANEKEEEVVDEKTQTLRAALSHVPKLGWTEAAIIAGTRDVGLSPAFAGAFPSKEAALVEFFMDECTQALVEELESREEELSKLVMPDRIATIVWVRLQMQVPYMQKWAQALSIQANPVNLPTTIKQRALLMDEIWHAAGDRSTDVDWYTKRAILAGIYSTTELYMLTDISPGFKDTQEFLEKRITDALDCRKTAQEAGHLAQAIGAGFQKTVDAFLNRGQPPSGFGFR
ncbi:unnamed protein product [Calypogeia fissa]